MPRKRGRRIAVFCALVVLGFLFGEVVAGGRGGGDRDGFGGGGRNRPNISRSGPAGGGSFSRGA